MVEMHKIPTMKLQWQVKLQDAGKGMLWQDVLPVSDRLVTPEQMTRDDVRAEAAAFMEDGGQAGVDLEGLLTLIRQNGITVESYEGIAKAQGKEVREQLEAIDIDGMSVCDKAQCEYVIAFNESAPYCRKMFTLGHEAGHCQMNHRYIPDGAMKDKQERDADLFANCVNSREAFWVLDQLMQGKTLILPFDGKLVFSLICAVRALRDEDGKFHPSLQMAQMIRAAINSVETVITTRTIVVESHGGESAPQGQG